MSTRATETASAGRTVERELEIAAPVEAVWRALTDAEELTRWFPMEARVTPGAGGVIWMRWSGEAGFETRIDAWVPGHHLRTSGMGGLGDVATDFYLQSRAGGTVLRVVSSGFGQGASWDNLVDGFGCGWDFELQGLKQYLERHAGRPRLVARARVLFDSGYEAGWKRLISAGWLPPQAAAGQRFTMPGADDVLAGVVTLWQPPRQFAATVPAWNDGLMRLELFCPDVAGHVTAWLSAYDVPAADVDALAWRWQDELAALFPASDVAAQGEAGS